MQSDMFAPKIQDTTDFPTRYVAWDTPRTWIVYRGDVYGSGNSRPEVAVYADRMTCERYGLDCGIYVEISRRAHSEVAHHGRQIAAGAYWYMDGQCSDTTMNRKQFNRGKAYRTFEEALLAGKAFVEEAEQFISK